MHKLSLSCERLSLIVRVNVVLNRTLLTVTDVSTTCAVVNFRVKVSCITSVGGMIGQLRRDIIGRLSVRDGLLENLAGGEVGGGGGGVAGG